MKPHIRQLFSIIISLVVVISIAVNLVGAKEFDAKAAGYPELVSVSSNGTQGNSFSISSSINADGRYVAFMSDASNLVPNDTNGQPDVFVHDRQTGTTERVSVSSNGTQGNGWSGARTS